MTRFTHLMATAAAVLVFAGPGIAGEQYVDETGFAASALRNMWWALSLMRQSSPLLSGSPTMLRSTGKETVRVAAKRANCSESRAAAWQ